MARRAAAAGLVSLAMVWAIWSGCRSGAEPNGAAGSAGAAGHAAAAGAGGGADGSDAVASGGAAGGLPATDAGPPYPGALPCQWPGWYASPALPPGCTSVCIPDDVTARVPALKWDDRSDWCPGCKWLEPRWWPGAQPDNAAPIWPSVDAVGAGPDFVELGLYEPDKSFLGVMYSGPGAPTAAVRSGQDTSCTRIALMTGQDGTVAARYRSMYTNQRWILRPKERASELMLATKPDFTYDDAFIGKDSPNQSFFTANWILDRFTGFMSLVDVKAGTAVKVQSLPGAPPGEYDNAVISGNAIFVEAFTDKTSWFVVDSGVAKPFLGGPDVDIDRFATDGTWIVWNEGSQLVVDPTDPSRMLAEHHDIYRAPFTTDGSKLQRQLLVPNSPQFYGTSTFANGYFTDITVSLIHPDGGLDYGHSEAWVVEVATGRAWTSDLSQGYVWGGQNYPLATELWGGISPDRYVPGYAYTIARVPYADMQQIQSTLP